MDKDRIAARLEELFSQQGFATPSVHDIKKASGVSMRTLYRHFPSKETMVIGALDHHHARYLDFLALDTPPRGTDAITELFQRLAQWMESNAPNGCLSMSAFAAFPNNTQVTASVKQHKHDMHRLLATLSGREDLAGELFLLHEGASTAWPTLGEEIIRTAQTAALKLMRRNDDDAA
ncbi:TetR/AcrR family transcriptional regulator [Pistricoccus aurantiacus]|uniref:TetR/AcrR family transcriptional regulator n=1 Tax=Pistricoccus aurantiacus TaxID=1883414 RepID=A0A5B8SZV8_9GAMM|nr:TetR/AcrR family transcriptional regulator [Pistricoccus aurantiacus]QEA40338.1 TetR/AcrR family transcriptional regulator [Pistricoccus aurantiacus]